MSVIQVEPGVSVTGESPVPDTGPGQDLEMSPFRPHANLTYTKHLLSVPAFWTHAICKKALDTVIKYSAHNY